jgi:hypothetical protein
MISRAEAFEAVAESLMSDVFVDGAGHARGNACKTWGELLQELDAELGGRGLQLVVVRFDGVEEPAFREPSALALPLAAVQRVDVETATPDALLRQSLADFAEGIGQTADEVARVSGLFRQDDVSPANEGLARLTGDLNTFAALVTTLRGPSVGIPSERLTIDGVSPEEQIERLAAWLESLIGAQSNQDWLTVADILEYDIEPVLRAWRTRLETLTHA